MDKILGIIIAASVLLVASMTLIFATTDSLNDFGEVADADSQVCQVLQRDYDEAVDEGNTDRADEIEDRASDRGCSWAP